MTTTQYLQELDYQCHLADIKQKLKTKETTRQLLQELDIFSVALNWRVYKTTAGFFLVGTEDTVSQAFLELDVAISYMLQQVYG